MTTATSTGFASSMSAHTLQPPYPPPDDSPAAPIAQTVAHILAPPKIELRPSSSNGSFPSLHSQPPSSMTAGTASSVPGTAGAAESPSDPLADVDAAIIEALKSAKERLFVLKLGENMEAIIADRINNPRLELQPQSSYQRLLVHRCAAYYRLTPEPDSQTKSIYINVTTESRMPARRIAELVPAESSPLPTFKIMRRAMPGSSKFAPRSNGIDEGESDPSEVGGSTSKGKKKHMTIAEREAAYNEARSRIFMGFEEKEREGAGKDTASVSASSSTPSLTAGGGSSVVSSIADGENASAMSPSTSGEPSYTARPKKSAEGAGSGRNTSAGYRGSPTYSREASPHLTYPSLYEPSSGTYEPIAHITPSAPVHQHTPPAHLQQQSPQPGYPPMHQMYPPYGAPSYLAPYPFYTYDPRHYPPTHPTPPGEQSSPYLSNSNTSPISASPPSAPPFHPFHHQQAYAWNQPPFPPHQPALQQQPQQQMQQPQAPHQGGMPEGPQNFYSTPSPYGSPPYHFYPPPPQPTLYNPDQPAPPPQPQPQSQSPQLPYPNNRNGYSTSSLPGSLTSSNNGSRAVSRNGRNQHQHQQHNHNQHNSMANGPSHHNHHHKKNMHMTPQRSGWSYGPGLGGGLGGGRTMGVGMSDRKRMSGGSSGPSSVSGGSAGTRTPADETMSTASSSASSSSSRRTYTSSSSMHPLPARPDWAVGLMPAGHSRSRSSSSHTPPSLKATDFPPLPGAGSDKSEQSCVSPSVPAGGAWNSTSGRALFVATSPSPSPRSLQQRGQQSSAPTFTFMSNPTPVFGTISGPPSASGETDDSDDVFRRPQPRGSADLYDPRPSISGVSFSPATQPVPSTSAPAITFGTTGGEFSSMRRLSPISGSVSFLESVGGGGGANRSVAATQAERHQPQNERARGEAVANAILVEKIANLSVSGDGGDGGGRGEGGGAEKGR